MAGRQPEHAVARRPRSARSRRAPVDQGAGEPALQLDRRSGRSPRRAGPPSTGTSTGSSACVMPSSRARASSDVASKPAVPNADSAALEDPVGGAHVGPSLIACHLPDGKHWLMLVQPDRRSPTTSTASASSSPAPPASSAPPWSSGCCARSPAASWSCWSARASAARSSSGPSARSSRTTPSTGCAPAADGGGELRRHDRPAGHADRRRRRHRRPRPRRRRAGPPLASCDIVIHSAATVSFDSPLDLAVEVNLLGPTRIAATLARRSASPPTSSPCRTCYVAGNRQGAAPEEPVDESPFCVDVDWRGEVAAARAHAGRRRGRVAHARHARPSFRERRPAASSAPPAPRCWPPRPSSSAAAGSPTSWSRPAAPGPPASAGPTPTPTPRPSARGRCSRQRGDVPVSASCARRSSSRRWPSPARAGSAASAWPSRSSSRYARGLLKEFPGVPEGIVDVIPVDLVVRRHQRVAAAARPHRRIGAPRSSRSASGSANPLRYRRLVDLVQRLVHRAPALRQRRPAHRRARVDLPRPRPGPGPARAGRSRSSRRPRRCSRRSRCGASRPSGRPRSRRSARRPSGPSPTSSSTAPTPSARRSTASTACSRCGTRCDADQRARLLLRPPGHRLGPLRPRDPPAVGRRARPGQDRRPAAPAADPATRLRRQVLSPERHLAAFDLENTLIASNVVASLLRGWPPAACRPTTGCASSPRRWPRRPRCCRSTARTAATSCATSTAATRAPPSAQLARRHRRDVQPAHPAPSRSPPPSAGCASTGALGHRTCSSPAPSTSSSSRSAAVRRHHLRRDGRRRRRRPTPASCTDVPPTGESAAQAPGSTTAPTHGLDLGRVRRLRRLDLRPAPARSGRLPGGGQPRDPPGRPGPQAGLARRALRQGARAAPTRSCRSGPPRSQPAAVRHAVGSADARAPRRRRREGAPVRTQAGAVSPPRWSPAPLRPRSRRRGRPAAAAATSTSPSCPAPTGSRFRPRLAGICGRDLATIDGRSSRYFEPIVSFPFVPGHEVVGDLDDGTRVVLIPVLHCATRGIDPVCASCAAGGTNRCERIAFGHLEPGLQTGFCATPAAAGRRWSPIATSSSPCPTT